MGSQNFQEHVQVPKGTSTNQAFTDARQEAAYAHGHGGYTGTMAEKHECIQLHTVSSRENADILAGMYTSGGYGLEIMNPQARDKVDDKWGPAGAIRYPIDAKTDGIVFFGWASS